MKTSLRTIFVVLAVALLFILSAYGATTYREEVVALMGENMATGIAIYIAITALSTIVAPLSSIPLIAVASILWGVVVAATASIIGWMLGALGAFYISRRYGRPLIERIISKEKLEGIEAKIETKNFFWSIVLLRMVVPVDVLSYVLGVFRALSWKTYTTATFIGIVPFAFIFAYFGTLSIVHQLLGLLGVGIVLFFVWRKQI